MSANKRKIPGIFSWFGFDASIVERFQSIKDASFTNVSIWLGKEENAVKNVQLHEFSDAARIFGLFIESAHAPFKDCIRMWSGSDSQKQELLTEYTKQIEFCSRNKIPVYVIHIAQKYNPPEPNEDGLFFMQELVKIASKFKTSIAIENTRTTTGLYYLLNKIDSPYLGLCYDSSHDFLYSECPTKILSDWGERLLYTHFSDNDGRSDSHWLPGAGVIDWDLIRAAFPRDAHDCISLEVVPQDSAADSMKSFLKKAYETGQWLVGKLVA